MDIVIVVVRMISCLKRDNHSKLRPIRPPRPPLNQGFKEANWQYTTLPAQHYTEVDMEENLATDEPSGVGRDHNQKKN